MRLLRRRSGVQAVGQFADSHQGAKADAETTQIAPTNANVPVRIGSPGGSGDVSQTNAALSGALAGNLNYTSQSTSQSQAGGGGVQAVDQEAGNHQWADADADTFQAGATNLNAPLNIGSGHGDMRKCGCDHGGGYGGGSGGGYGGSSHGDKPKCGCDHGGYGGGYDGGSGGGDVSQKNIAGAFGAALNANATDQAVNQSQGGGYDAAKCGCGHGSDGVQAVGQFAWNKQSADSKANAKQLWPENANTPVRIGSWGDDGSVDQTNAALALSLAANLNYTRQEVTQTQ